MKVLLCKGTLVSNTADTYGRLIVTKGMSLKRFQNNPVVLYGHDANRPIGNVTKLTKKVDGNTLIEFTVRQDMTQPEIYNGIKAGVIKGLSSQLIRLADNKAHVAPTGIYDYIPNSELMEASVVAMGRNSDCRIDSVTESDGTNGTPNGGGDGTVSTSTNG